MGIQPSQVSSSEEEAEERETEAIEMIMKEDGAFGADGYRSPMNWLGMLSSEMHWSFVFGVVVVYGVSQGLGGAIWRVAADYYWKDVQMVQPSEAQIYQGITSIPWIVKPLWGLLTDVLPVAGYRRRPYFVLAGR